MNRISIDVTAEQHKKLKALAALQGKTIKQFVLERTKNCHGFYGASSMERLPVEVALTEQTKAFKALRTG